MNFTRDPIIETVITPREGCKLVVRNSKGAAQEDYLVDAIEVVSFGHSFFFRSIEKPKSFLVPVSDYEVFETKEPRLALKNAAGERSIKIGGGREGHRPMKESNAPEGGDEDLPSGESRSSDRKRDRRRRGRRGRDRQESFQSAQAPEEMVVREEVRIEERGEPLVETQAEVKAPPFISKLFPPPPTLIKETLSRYKPVDSAPEDIVSLNEEGNEPPFHSERAPDDDFEE